MTYRDWLEVADRSDYQDRMAAATFEPEDDIAVDFEKFCDAVHYIAQAAPPSALGRVKLHETLYFADMLRYLETGRPLTGADFLKQKFGPTARPLTRALHALTAASRVAVSLRQVFGVQAYTFASLSPLATNRLADDERALLDAVIAFVCAHSADEISEISHTKLWEMASPGERLPYYMALSLVPAEITDEDRDWAAGEARRHGLAA